MSQFGNLELLITRHILPSPLKFEVSRVDCSTIRLSDKLWVIGVQIL